MPKAKRSKVWLYFTAKDANSAACNKCFKMILCKEGNTSNLMKHLATYSILLNAEKCTVFDSLLRDLTPCTSTAGVVPVIGPEQHPPKTRRVESWPVALPV
ncbi:hypothetical protein Ciccas_013085 [Cichlidogyrus casuarinus]|uniref:BED-type domain-containing protein n=1 Tax=Cichlidogyrus casuarinus TaxID=1844966 RepID=A0ABD2PLL5_9PLAT